MKKVKAKEMVIRNLADVVELVNYNADLLDRQIRRISKNSRRVTVLSGIVAALVIISSCQRQKFDEELYNLRVRVKKLENSEGE